MGPHLEIKLKGMLWDLPSDKRDEIFRILVNDPLKAFKDEDILIRVLSTLTWYEMTELAGSERLYGLLSEKVINRLFPSGRRKFYRDAKRLLSKYTLSPAG